MDLFRQQLQKEKVSGEEKWVLKNVKRGVAFVFSYRFLKTQLHWQAPHPWVMFRTRMFRVVGMQILSTSAIMLLIKQHGSVACDVSFNTCLLYFTKGQIKFFIFRVLFIVEWVQTKPHTHLHPAVIASMWSQGKKATTIVKSQSYFISSFQSIQNTFTQDDTLIHIFP